MDETKVTATLPHLTMEIIHREMPEENAEGVTIHLKATPSFQAFAGFLGAPGSLPNPWLPLMTMWANPLASSFTAWQTLFQAPWFQPWISPASPSTRIGRK